MSFGHGLSDWRSGIRLVSAELGNLISQKKKVKTVQADIPGNFYCSQKGRLIRKLVKVISRVQPELVANYGEEVAAEIHQQILVEFERLLLEAYSMTERHRMRVSISIGSSSSPFLTGYAFIFS